MRIDGAFPMAPLPDRDAHIREVAQEFEALLLAKVLENLSATVGGSSEGEDTSTLRGFVWMELARELSHAKQLGLAEAVYRQLSSEPLAPNEQGVVAPKAVVDADSRSHEPEGFLRPVEGTISSRFGPRRDPFDGSKRLHQGLDFAAPEGTPVRSSEAGTVKSSRFEPGYGNTVVIDHGGGVTTRYAHLKTLSVGAGERVGRGQLLGEVGATGRATGPHLHYEVRADREARDPERWFRG